MRVRIQNGQVADVTLSIFEPPRFFEAFLRGRHYTEAPDITARICGICPVAYQISAVNALESLLGVEPSGQLRALRRLLYCGEWIASHGLHIHMLHAPDFYGYSSALEMAKQHRDVVERGLQLKKVGNAIMSTLAGREIHPINVRVGGFYSVPSKASLQALAPSLRWARDAAEQTVRWAAALPFPELERDYVFVALRHPHEYPMSDGRLVSSSGLDSPVQQYQHHFASTHAATSTALRGRLADGRAPLMGPLARYNLNFDRLPDHLQDLAHAVGLGARCRNPFKSIVVRSMEVLLAVQEALRIVEAYSPPSTAALPAPAKPGEGHGASEAPRGTLYHRYCLDAEGNITDATITPPTAQNQPVIEEDLYELVAANMDADDATLQWHCEQAIRNYDPCISCATHFLRVQVEREP